MKRTTIVRTGLLTLGGFATALPPAPAELDDDGYRAPLGASPATRKTTQSPPPTSTVSADSSVVPTTVVSPVPQHAAIAILGSMIFLILTLLAVLVMTTWVDPASGSETAIVLSS